MSILKFWLTFFKALLVTRGRLLQNYLIIRRSRIFDQDFYLTEVSPQDHWWIKFCPLLHYLVIGEPAYLNPNPLFLLSFYVSQLPTPPEKHEILAHYIRQESFGARRPNPFFSGLYYVEQYHDVLATRQHPLAHYYWHGWREGRNPIPAFQTQDYIKRYKIDPSIGPNPLGKFLQEEALYSSELGGLPPGKPVAKPTAKNPFPAGLASVDLIIPVYRRPDLVENLFDSLLLSPDWSRVRSCIVVDDCGDRFTTKYLQDLSARSEKIKLIKNDENLGFLRSVNKAFESTSSDVVILVNSDVQLPLHWLNRLVAPIELKPDVALVTPLATSGANLSVSLRPGQSWVDVDEIISAASPQYPDACTGIGYLMAIRRAAIKTPTLFDDIFRHGYGEDTDLHYRLLNAGWRSVICDNLVILHKGSASYELDDQKAKIYEANRKIFFERWGEIHQKCHNLYIKNNPLAQILSPSSHSLQELEGDDIDVLFISPTNNRSIGGVKIIFEMASYLCEHGIKAKIFCTEQTASLSQHVHDSLMPIFRKETLYRLVKNTKVIVGTGIGVAKEFNEFALHYRSRCWWLVQGPEGYFGNGSHYRQFVDQVLSVDHVITVSEYLSTLIKDLGVQRITTLPLGPDPLAFYPRDIAREPKSIAIHLIDTPDKGSRFALSWAEEAHRLGLSVHFFGSSRLYDMLPKDLGTHHGKLDADGLAKLFSRCEYYLDLSIMEGLGLLPLEAYLCGCTPVMTRKGAPEFIFGNSGAAIWLDSHLDYSQLSRLPRPPHATPSRDAIPLSARMAYAKLLNECKGI